ncbi:MAG: hypothetical protein ABIK62_03220 [candidate division WOR-3 bacterium]
MNRCLVLLALIPVVGFSSITIDTIGGTTYDWVASGPCRRMIGNDPERGVHALWMFSRQAGPGYTDRNMCYNFRDAASGAWTWIDPSEFMNSGTGSFTARTGFGSLDIDPQTGCACVVAHRGSSTLYPTCVRDAAPGSGTFEECPGTPTGDAYIWPQASVTEDGVVHCIVSDDVTGTGLYYMRIAVWCSWSVPVEIGSPPPGYPSYFVEASRQSEQLIVSWVNANALDQMFCRLSADGGTNWDQILTIPPPPAFGSQNDTIAAFHFSSNSLLWDNLDRWHLVVAVGPAVGGQAYVLPAEIWHYSPDNTPAWSRVVRASCDPVHLAGSVGYNALYAARPMLAIDQGNSLYCVWEQFDSLNLEPATARLRADIFVAASSDNGQTWGRAVKLTPGDNCSYRFPSIARWVDDHLHILCEADLQAGFRVMNEGGSTNNPILYIRVPREEVLPTAVAEDRITTGQRPPLLRAVPNPFVSGTIFSSELGSADRASLAIYDAAGGLVRHLGEWTNMRRIAVGWDGRDETGRAVMPGIYFGRLTTSSGATSRKLVCAH